MIKVKLNSISGQETVYFPPKVSHMFQEKISSRIFTISYFKHMAWQATSVSESEGFNFSW